MGYGYGYCCCLRAFNLMKIRVDTGEVVWRRWITPEGYDQSQVTIQPNFLLARIESVTDGYLAAIMYRQYSANDLEAEGVDGFAEYNTPVLFAIRETGARHGKILQHPQTGSVLFPGAEKTLRDWGVTSNGTVAWARPILFPSSTQLTQYNVDGEIVYDSENAIGITSNNGGVMAVIGEDVIVGLARGVGGSRYRRYNKDGDVIWTTEVNNTLNADQFNALSIHTVKSTLGVIVAGKVAIDSTTLPPTTVRSILDFETGAVSDQITIEDWSLVVRVGDELVPAKLGGDSGGNNLDGVLTAGGALPSCEAITPDGDVIDVRQGTQERTIGDQTVEGDIVKFDASGNPLWVAQYYADSVPVNTFAAAEYEPAIAVPLSVCVAGDFAYIGGATRVLT